MPVSIRSIFTKELKKMCYASSRTSIITNNTETNLTGISSYVEFQNKNLIFKLRAIVSFTLLAHRSKRKVCQQNGMIIIGILPKVVMNIMGSPLHHLCNIKSVAKKLEYFS